MQKISFTLQALVVALMLIVAGLVSPSNGVDDKISGSPSTMLMRAVVIIFTTMLLYFVGKKIKSSVFSRETMINKVQSQEKLRFGREAYSASNEA